VFVAIGTITVTVIGALLSDVFSPVSENIKDIFSPPPDTTIQTHMTFDSAQNKVNKNVSSGETIPARAIVFTFNSTGGWRFECSIDGLPFEECISPKHYTNLETEEGHIFKVRAKGILGNVDKSPATFNFTSVTSSSVRGVIKNSTIDVDKATIWLEPKMAGINTTSDNKGKFYFGGIGEGEHKLHIVPNYNFTRSSIGTNFTETFFVPPGAQTTEKLILDLNDLAVEIAPPLKEIIKKDQNKINPNFKPDNNSGAQKYYVNLMQQSEPTSRDLKKFRTDIWLNTSEATLSKITNVTYYLHPTFTPDKVTIHTPENKFGLNFTNWGKFLLKAKVYFNDSTIKDLELPPDQWKITKPN
jgi:prokaryotic YEATS domain